MKDFHFEGEGRPLEIYSRTMSLGKSGVEDYQGAKYNRAFQMQKGFESV
jgi:hypothetical protein